MRGMVFGGLVAAVVLSCCGAAVEGQGLIAGTGALGGPATRPAEEQNPSLWKPRTTSVAVFKNGMGFFVREGEVSLRDGWAVAEEVPPAAFGTLAIYSHANDELVDIVGSGPGEVVEFDGKDAADDLATRRSRLTGWRNLKMSIGYTQRGLERTASGKLVSVGADFAVLERDGNNFAVPVEGISQAQVLELPIRVHVAADDKRVISRTRLGMAYLRKGVTWIPEYTLRVLDDQNAELTLRGTFVNEAEDLVHTDVNFVVGVPNFLHADLMEPIAVRQMIRTIGAAVAPAQIQSQIMNRAALGNDNGAPQAATGNVVERAVGDAGRDVMAAVGSLPRLETAAGSDFTVYTRKDMTLRRGEKAIVTLFVKKVKYSHHYSWDLPGTMNHSLVLLNDTDSAWTTGPVLAMSGGQPLCEDLLRYTPREGRCEVPVTASINIAQSHAEEETARKLRAYQPEDRGPYLDLVTLVGKITVKNFEKRPVDIAISAPVAGKPIEASDDGILQNDTTNLKLRERSGTVKWTIKVEPGATKVLTYQYERYVPSN